MKLNRHSSLRPDSESGFTVLEMLVAVTLLAVIIGGLLIMFNQTTRAFRVAGAQVDILENGRATMSLLTRELQQVAVAGREDVPNILVTNVSIIDQPRPGGGDQVNVLQDAFWLTRYNDDWTANGYFIDVRGAGVGTLYRFTMTTNGPASTTLDFYPTFVGANKNHPLVHRVAEGVVNFEVRAYDAQGLPYTNLFLMGITNHAYLNYGPNYSFSFSNTYLPAYLELELGVLEPAALRQFNALQVNATTARTFLQNQAGRVHLFRQRIQLHNHNEP